VGGGKKGLATTGGGSLFDARRLHWKKKGDSKKAEGKMADTFGKRRHELSMQKDKKILVVSK